MSFLPPCTPEEFVETLLECPYKHRYDNDDKKELIKFFHTIHEEKKEDYKIIDITLDDLSKFSNFPDGVREEIFNDIKMYYSIGSEFRILLRKLIKITSCKSSGSMVKSANKR